MKDQGPQTVMVGLAVIFVFFTGGGSLYDWLRFAVVGYFAYRIAVMNCKMRVFDLMADEDAAAVAARL